MRQIFHHLFFLVCCHLLPYIARQPYITRKESILFREVQLQAFFTSLTCHFSKAAQCLWGCVSVCVLESWVEHGEFWGKGMAERGSVSLCVCTKRKRGEVGVRNLFTMAWGSCRRGRISLIFGGRVRESACNTKKEFWRRNKWKKRKRWSPWED